MTTMFEEQQIRRTVDCIKLDSMTPTPTPTPTRTFSRGCRCRFRWPRWNASFI